MKRSFVLHLPELLKYKKGNAGNYVTKMRANKHFGRTYEILGYARQTNMHCGVVLGHREWLVSLEYFLSDLGTDTPKKESSIRFHFRLNLAKSAVSTKPLHYRVATAHASFKFTHKHKLTPLGVLCALDQCRKSKLEFA